MLNEQFTWLTPFIQLECPSFAWRTKDAETKFNGFLGWVKIPGKPSRLREMRNRTDLRHLSKKIPLCVFAPLRQDHLPNHCYSTG